MGQEKECNGFANAIYSGFPTISIARILNDFIFEKLVNGEVSGLYHLSSNPISKYDLLNKISTIYNKEIKINKEIDFKIDRSLNSDRFQNVFNYKPETWDFLVKEMYKSYGVTREISNK